MGLALCVVTGVDNSGTCCKTIETLNNYFRCNDEDRDKEHVVKSVILASSDASPGKGGPFPGFTLALELCCSAKVTVCHRSVTVE